MKIIARIESEFSSKFGIPRQSGYSDSVKSTIVFEEGYRNAEALRGIEQYSHLWLLWLFSESQREEWSPTVRPPRLGGNTRMGVFATRSPFRPNPIGLSSVKLVGVEYDTPRGAVITVSGADILDGTPILDIKPYLAYTDSHPEASGGFTKGFEEDSISVNIPESIAKSIPPQVLSALEAVLKQDPRPAYHDFPDRIYGMEYAGLEVKFTVADQSLTVISIDSIR